MADDGLDVKYAPVYFVTNNVFGNLKKINIVFGSQTEGRRCLVNVVEWVARLCAGEVDLTAQYPIFNVTAARKKQILH